jgi:hypothetical protein
MRITILAIVLAILMGAGTYSPLAATPWKISSVELPGVTGVTNNVAFAYDRYVLIAPYAPTKPVEDNNDLSQLDNSFIYLVDTKKPSEGAQSFELKSYDPTDTQRKTVYYPSRILFDAESSTVFVRGTRFVEEEDGGLREIDVIAYTRLNLDDNDKPVFSSNVVIIDIKEVDSNISSDAPMDFALAHGGKLLLFTNGASIFSYNVDKGYVYQVDIVPQGYFSDDSKISYLDIDKATNTLVVCWNKKDRGEGEAVKVASELSFYAIDNDGTLPLRNRAYAYNFVDGTAMTAGSTVAITSAFTKASPDVPVPINAYFVTNDGSLCQVEFDDQAVPANVKQLRKFDELAIANGGDGSPRIIKYDADSRVVGIVKQGFTAQIRRPSNGRPGRGRGSIVRALNAFNHVEDPAVVLVKFGKKNKISSGQVYVDDFKNEDGLSNFVYGRDSQWLVSTHTGKLFSVGLTDDSAENGVQRLAEIGQRIDHIDFFDTRGSVVAISSYEADADGGITSPGALVVAKMGDYASQSLNARLFEALKSPSLVFGAVTPTIRRPCNVKR